MVLAWKMRALLQELVDGPPGACCLQYNPQSCPILLRVQLDGVRIKAELKMQVAHTSRTDIYPLAFLLIP